MRSCRSKEQHVDISPNLTQQHSLPQTPGFNDSTTETVRHSHCNTTQFILPAYQPLRLSQREQQQQQKTSYTTQRTGRPGLRKPSRETPAHTTSSPSFLPSKPTPRPSSHRVHSIPKMQAKKKSKEGIHECTYKRSRDPAT